MVNLYERKDRLTAGRRFSATKMAWRLLLGIALIGFVLCLHAYLSSSSIRGREFNWRGLCVYAAVMCFAGLGLFRDLGPIVFYPLLASLISVTFVFSGVNAVAQLCFFIALGLVIGLTIESKRKQRRE
jgi:hypothetical protein